MTEQQHPHPIDELFRKKFDNLPDSPADSGWDTPSGSVWQHVQSNIQQPQKGWSGSSIALLAALLIGIIFGLYWFLARPAEKPNALPQNPPVEQPASSPDNTEPTATQTHQTPEQTSPTRPAKDVNAKTRINPEAKKPKPVENAADPLPGSKNTLPPNSTEAGKKKSSEN